VGELMPLTGVRVLDFGRYIAGPYCAALLADYGAEVIRVEAPEGNDDRYSVGVAEDGSGGMYLQMGRNKSCLTLRPSMPEGREIIRRLVRSVDVIVANLPDQVLEKLELDYDHVAALNPRVILATASSFGSTGPLSNHVGFDAVGQAMSGAAYLSGTAERPSRAQMNYVDYGTALHLAFGVMVALRQRDVTGKGQRVSSSLLATALAFGNNLSIDAALNDVDRPPMGNRAYSSAPTDMFRTADGWIMTQIVGNAIFARWAELVGEAQLVDDPRFGSDMDRGDHGDILCDIMQRWCEGKNSAEVLALLGEARVPAAPVLRPAEVLEQPQVQAMGLVEKMDYPGLPRPAPIIRSPIHLSDSPKQALRPAPTLGEGRDEILRMLGYGADDIQDLINAKVI
jgi:crotonobetainyl-CoA:carnitine CoA-transferase CaiB-like acyl-CoA transferase